MNIYALIYICFNILIVGLNIIIILYFRGQITDMREDYIRTKAKLERDCIHIMEHVDKVIKANDKILSQSSEIMDRYYYQDVVRKGLKDLRDKGVEG